jgi:DNA topoisomerase III
MGHLLEQDFGPQYKSWSSCDPSQLFDVDVRTFVGDDKKDVASNIEKEARGCKALYIWTDCDREGEHIGSEIRSIALKVNPRLEVKRAKFSNIERS